MLISRDLSGSEHFTCQAQRKQCRHDISEALLGSADHSIEQGLRSCWPRHKGRGPWPSGPEKHLKKTGESLPGPATP